MLCSDWISYSDALCGEIVLNVAFNNAGNPCCSEPCQNRGVCTPMGKGGYECDCTRTGYTGPNCTTRKYEGTASETSFLELRRIAVHPAHCPVSHVYSRVSHVGQSVAEAIAQHCPLPSHPLQGFLEHHQQHLIPQGRHHEIRPDL